MNKKFRFIPVALAALMLGACSTNDDVVDGGEKGEGTTSYMAVQIVNAGNASGTRASYDPTDDTATSGDYEDGTGAESTITSARFYFFDGSGNAYNVISGGVNFIDKELTKDASGQDHSSTVEGASTATLVIENSKDAAPASMVAIVNYDKDNDTYLGNTSKSLSDLQAIKSEDLGSTTSFVMSNSVYDGACAVSVGNCVKQDPDEAKKTPVTIYVERVLAKVNTKSTGTQTIGGRTVYKVGDINNGTTPVYAEIQGWSVADENKTSYLLKNVGGDYSKLSFTWSSDTYPRSFWATSTTDRGTKNVWSWKEMADNKLNSALYTQESTPTTMENFDLKKNDITKVVVAAKLVDKDGKDLELCLFQGVYLIGEKQVKNAILKEMKDHYRKVVSGVTGDLEVSDLSFPNPTSATNAYKVYAKVNALTGNDKYEKLNANGDAWEDCTADDINTYLSSASMAAQIRKGGRTYYYTPIRHLGTGTANNILLGDYGVVRNHSYEVSITGITGFGTAVYNPDADIDPEPPVEESTYLAAQIRVLSWRIVKSEVNLTTN